MSYVIMNFNSVDGLLRGVFQRLNNLFYKGVDPNTEITFEGLRIFWTNAIDEAEKFQTEEAAWTQAYYIWGMHFTQHNLVVVQAKDEVLERSEKYKELYR